MLYMRIFDSVGLKLLNVFGKSPAVPTKPVVDPRSMAYARDLTDPGVMPHTELMCAD